MPQSMLMRALAFQKVLGSGTIVIDDDRYNNRQRAESAGVFFTDEEWEQMKQAEREFWDWEVNTRTETQKKFF